MASDFTASGSRALNRRVWGVFLVSLLFRGLGFWFRVWGSFPYNAMSAMVASGMLSFGGEGKSWCSVGHDNRKALRTDILRLLGPKDHAIYGFWAILSLRVAVTATRRLPDSQ